MPSGSAVPRRQSRLTCLQLFQVAVFKSSTGRLYQTDMKIKDVYIYIHSQERGTTTNDQSTLKKDLMGVQLFSST